MPANTTTSFNDNGLCIVAILKDEERFLDEWILYHKAIGADHFFLYDDDESLALSHFVRPHQEYVTVIPWCGKGRGKKGLTNQLVAYSHAIEHFVQAYEWVAFIDIDEFIVLRQHENLKAFLEPISAPAVALNWHTFGHNGHYDDPEGLITSSLTRRKAGADPVNVKSITRTVFIESIASPHHCLLRSGNAVDPNNKPYTTDMYTGKTDVAHINHYRCRSFTTWMKRASRGDVNFGSRYCPPEHKWRLSEEDCLKEFVTTVAFDENELPDFFMLKFKDSLLQGKYMLNRNKSTFHSDAAERLQTIRSVIDEQLDLIAEAVLNGIEPSTGIGLLDGKSGAVLFLMHYARYKDNEPDSGPALEIFNNISEEIDSEYPVNYANGLSGFGALTEYLVQNFFIKADTNETLEDLDTLIGYHLVSGSLETTDMPNGLSGIGKYYIYRCSNQFNNDGGAKSRLQQSLDDIIGMLSVSFDTYPQLLNIIDFLTGAYPYCRDQNKLKDYLCYAADKLETMALEDEHFNISPGRFNPLSAALLIKKASVKTGNAALLATSYTMLNKYGQAFADHISPADTLSLAAVSGLWLLYKKLYDEFRDEKYKEEALKWLQLVLEKSAASLQQELSLPGPDGADGRVQELVITGMSLLSAVDLHAGEWTGLIPFYDFEIPAAYGSVK